MIATATKEERRAKQRDEAREKANAVRARRAAAYRDVRGDRALSRGERRLLGAQKVAAILRDPGDMGDLDVIRLLKSIPWLTEKRASKIVAAAGVRRMTVRIDEITPRVRGVIADGVDQWATPAPRVH